MPLDGPRLRVAVRPDFVNGLAITFAIDNEPDHFRIVHFGPNGFPSEMRLENKMTVFDPSIFISQEFGRALYEELARFFSGTPDNTTGRTDLLHERGRVDKLIAVVSEIALGGDSGYQEIIQTRTH